MKYSLVSFALLTATSFIHADGPTLKDARERLLHGNYAECILSSTRSSPRTPRPWRRRRSASARPCKARANMTSAFGNRNGAQGTSQERGPRGATSGSAVPAGRWDDAQKAADAAVKSTTITSWHAGSSARRCRHRGELKKADEAFRWFVVTYTNRSNMDMDISDPDVLLHVGLAGCERARWIPDLSDQFSFILNDVWTDAVKKDKDFWPAEYPAARMLTEKIEQGRRLSLLRKCWRSIRAPPRCWWPGSGAFAHLEIKDADQLVPSAPEVQPAAARSMAARVRHPHVRGQR